MANIVFRKIWVAKPERWVAKKRDGWLTREMGG
jgi:hypothetical protein